MKVHRFWILTLICFTIIPSSIADDPKIVCYYTNWSIYRPGNAKYSPQNINPYLCTHLIYAFGGFTKDNTLQPFDKYQDIEKGGYAKFTGLKTYNKNLKTLLAIGGWNEGSARFSPLVGNSERRREFVKNTVKYLRQNHFDGLDLDWEYPTFRDGGKSKDRANYAQLVQELSEEFDRESSKTGRTRLLLTLAIPAGVDKIDKGYDVIKLNQYLDWFNVLTYDYHDSFEPSTNHHAPLFPLEEDNEYNYDNELNIDYSVKHLINAGADRQKLVLGIPTYGRSYTLFNADATDIGAPTDGPGEPGDATREKGFLAYYEICQNIKSDDEWTVMHPNDKAMGPYSYRNDQWISYDDEKMARKKAMYVAENNLGGIMFWSIDTDDFRGTCTGKPYPLIEAAKEGLLDALGVKTNEPTRKTTTRNKNRPNTQQKNQASTSFKENFNRRRRPTPKPTVKPTQSSIVYNLKTTTPEPPTTPDPGSDFKCEEDGFFPHPRDCKKYFWCLDSGPSNLGIVAHQFTCPSGLVFNKQADSCDYTRNVVCSKTNPPTTKARPPPTTTYKPTTKLFTTQRTTTNIPTTTPTTPSFDDDDDDEVYEYENENAEPERDIEDPKVIKELIDLIRKAGGLEELEKQLKFTEEILPETGNTDKLPTTQSTFSKSLYDKFLKRKQLENRFVNTEGTNKVKPDSEVHNEKINIPKVDSTRYSSVIRNSRPNSQIAGLENLPEFEGFLKEKPQYVTIQRFRTTTNSNVKIVDSEETDNDEDDASVETSTRSAFQPQYVNIQRNRFTTQSTVLDEEDSDEFGQSPLATISVTISPQYTTINRRRRPNVTDTVEISPISETDTTTQVVEVTSLLNARTQTRYKPISRTTSKIDSEPDTTKKYVDSRDEEFEVSTETVALNIDTKYQNINRRNTTLAAVPTKEDEIIVPQTTVLIAAEYSDGYVITTTQKETTPETTVINLNNNKDELITNHNLTDYSLTTPTTSFTTDHSNETFDGLNDIQNTRNKTETTVQEESVTVENNITEFVTTQLSSPSPFEFQKEHNEVSLNQTPATVKIITQILGYLNLDDLKNASSACKSWHYASTDPQIVRTLILQPTEKTFPKICKSNRKYGILKLQFLNFVYEDSYYFEFFEKFCPFVHELHILNCTITIHHFLKLFELSSCLETFLFSECGDCMTDSFRLDCDGEAKKRIIRNLSGVKNIVIDEFLNIPLITDILRYATNLENFEFFDQLEENRVSYEELCTVFDNDNIGNLKHLNFHFNLSHCVEGFLTSFVKIKNLNLKSLRIAIPWYWEDDVYNSSLFRQFVMKLHSLVEFSIFGLEQDQLSLICQHMVNLKSLDCSLDNVHLIYELGNLKHLEILRCRFSRHTFISLLETDKFFKCKFENLRLLNFEGFVTEPNLIHLCEYHPNLIELKVTGLLTRNLEIIFKGLTKLRVLAIYFGFRRLKTRPDLSDIIDDVSLFDSKWEYHYKISRLQDLEEFHLDELVRCVREDDVRQLKKLRLTNLPELFNKIKIDPANTPNCMVYGQ